MRLLQPVVDPDPKPTSVRGLSGEITANNTSQGKQCSNSLPAVIPNNQETVQCGTAQDLFWYRK